MQHAPDDQIPVPTTEYIPSPPEAKERRFVIPWEWWDAVAIYFLWIIMAGGTAALIGSAFADPSSEISTSVGILAAVSLLSVTTLAWVGFRGERQGVRDAIRRSIGVKRPTAQDWGLGVLYGVGAFVVIQLGLGLAIQSLVQVLGREIPPIQEGLQGAAQASGAAPLILGLAVVVLGPIGEELLYRGVLYQGLAKHMPAWPAIGLSGLAFGVTHVEGFVVALTFPLGMLLAWVMRRYGTLVVPVVAHVVFNLIGLVLVRVGGSGVG